MPRRLKRRGYRATWPAAAEVFGVAGVPNDGNVPPGTTIAQDTTTRRLYRKETGVWLPVAGTPHGG
jgi:hypothetical protein